MSVLRATVLGLFAGCSLLLFGASFAILMPSVVRGTAPDVPRALYGIGLCVLQVGVLGMWVYALYEWISRQSFPRALYRAACAINVSYCAVLIAWTCYVLGGWPQRNGFTPFIYFSIASVFVGVFVAYDRRGRGKCKPGPSAFERAG